MLQRFNVQRMCTHTQLSDHEVKRITASQYLMFNQNRLTHRFLQPNDSHTFILNFKFLNLLPATKIYGRDVILL